MPSALFRKLSLLVTAMVLGLSIPAATSSAQAATKIDVRTVCLQNKVGPARQIRIHGELDGNGVLLLDPNTCTVTQFGDQGICTKIAPLGREVKIVRSRLADPTGQGRKLYQLVPTQELDSKYFLVVPSKSTGAYRLIVDEENDHRRVITLENSLATKPPAGGKPELCKNAKYRALQKGGKVTIYAVGQHPTAGYKTAFEQLPIRIFPPQFRLVCVKPSGIVAQVITPFVVNTSFAAGSPVKQVIVHDAKGQHKIPVVQSGSD